MVRIMTVVATGGSENMTEVGAPASSLPFVILPAPSQREDACVTEVGAVEGGHVPRLCPRHGEEPAEAWDRRHTTCQILCCRPWLGAHRQDSGLRHLKARDAVSRRRALTLSLGAQPAMGTVSTPTPQTAEYVSSVPIV
jgi:hypothetical protein